MKVSTALVATVFAGTALSTFIAEAPKAHAWGCHNAPFVTWCDDPPVNTRGDHLHGVCSPYSCDFTWQTGDGITIPYAGAPL